MTTPLFLLRCVQLGISIRDLDLLTIGLVNDMFVESTSPVCAAGNFHPGSGSADHWLGE